MVATMNIEETTLKLKEIRKSYIKGTERNKNVLLFNYDLRIPIPVLEGQAGHFSTTVRYICIVKYSTYVLELYKR